MNANPETPAPDSSPLKLDRVPGLCAWGLLLLGLLHAARAALLERDHPGLALLDAAYLLVGYALAGIVLGHLMRTLETWPARQAVASAAPTEPFPATSPPAHSVAAVDPVRGRTLAEIRQAIRSAKWDDARERIEALATDHADDPHLETLNHELQSARDAARDDHKAQLEAARQVNDPDRVLELHGSLAPLLDAEARNSLEADLSKWFLRLIHNRLRTGKIQTDVAHLAGRIAEAFSHTVEGASLRARCPPFAAARGSAPAAPSRTRASPMPVPHAWGLGSRPLRLPRRESAAGPQECHVRFVERSFRSQCDQPGGERG